MGGGGEGLLLLGGEGPERGLLEPVLKNAPLVIAADSGFELAVRLGIQPDLLVGDLDSLAASRELASFPPERIRRYPREKDETDAELGLRLLHERGCRRVVLAGGGGGRLAHLQAIIGLFERFPAPAAWYTARELVQRIDGRLELADCRGRTVSFFPLGRGAGAMKSEGLHWPLDGLAWPRGRYGVSNLITADRAWVRVARGCLLMILEF